MNEEVMDSKELQVGDVVTGSVTKVEEETSACKRWIQNRWRNSISELANVHIEKASDVVELDRNTRIKGY